MSKTKLITNVITYQKGNRIEVISPYDNDQVINNKLTENE